MNTCFLLFLCCISCCYVATLSNQDKLTGLWSTNVDVKNITASSEDSPWSIELKMSNKLEIGVTKPEAPNKLGYYKFYSTPATWFGAKKVCEHEGTHLLVLNSEREFITIKGVWDTYPELFPDNRNKYLHIALHDLLQEGQFITLDGRPVTETGYSKWGTGEPNSGISANCLLVSRDGLYYDSYCNDMFAFLCEI